MSVRDAGDEFEVCRAVTVGTQRARQTGKSAEVKNDRTIRNVDTFFKDISELPDRFGSVSVHKARQIAAEASVELRNCRNEVPVSVESLVILVNY
jgi:hypothetical protein